MLKKLLSVLLASSLLLGICPAALAQQVESQDKSWLQTFTGLAQNTAPEEMLLSGVPANYTGADALPEEQRNIAVTQGAAGKFGKKADDMAFVARTKWDDGSLPTIAPDTKAFAGPTLKNDAGSDDKTAILPGITALAADDVLHISFEYAINNYAAARQVKLRTRPTSKVVSDTSAVFMTFEKDTGALKVFGKDASDFVMPLGQWVRFDCVFKEPKRTGGSYADVYANGVKLIEDYVFDAKSGKPMDVIDPLNGLASVVFTFPMGLVDGVYPETETYIDNYSIDIVKELPQITGVTLTHSDAAINANIDNAAKTIVLPNSITAAELLGGLTPQSGVEIVTLDGAAQSGDTPLQSGYIRVLAENGRDLYYNLTAFEQDYYLNENFNGKSITNQAELEQYTALTLTGAGAAVQTQNALGGRGDGDTSLTVSAVELGEEAVTLGWTPDTVIDSDAITIEQSVLLQEGTALELTADFGAAAGSIVQFGSDKKIYANGTDTGRAWQAGRFYRVVATLDRAAGTWNIYINGEPCVTDGPVGADGFTGLAGLKATLSSETGGTAVAAFDDFKVHTGEYVPSADDSIVTAISDNCILDEQGKTVYILPETSKAELLGYLKLENCVLDAVYTDAAMTQKTADESLADGNVLLFVNAVGTVLEGYTVSVIHDILGIESTSGYAFDNEKRTIMAPVGTPVGEFYKNVTLYSGHSGQIVDETGNPVADDAVVALGTAWKYRVSYKTFSAEYTLETVYFSESFDDLAGRKLFESGSVYNGLRLDISKVGGSAENVFIEGVKDGGENVARLYSKASNPAGDAKITLRYDNIAPEKTKSAFVLTWDQKISDLNGLNSIVFRYTHKDGTPNKYHNLFNVQGGNVELSGSSIASYSSGEWVRIAIAIAPGSGNTRTYVNGKLVYNRAISLFQKLADHIDDIIFTHGVTNGTRETLIDNLAFYPVYSIDSYDASAMDSAVASTYDIIGKDNTVTGYGPATRDSFLSLFTFPEGASQAVLSSDGTPIAAETAVEAGMTLVVTSADGQYTTRYPIGEKMRIETSLNIGGREMGYLIEGEANATAQVYSALPQEMKLLLEYMNTADPSKSKTVYDQKTVTGAAEFDTGVAAQVQNTEGESLTMRLTDPVTGTDFVEPVIVRYTGQLDLGSEIMAAKNGATSIVTLTMDDGVQGYVEKFNNLYKTYGLRGTSMVWSDRLASNQAFYSRIFEEGYIDLGSHSKTHTTLTSSVSDEVRTAELKGAQSEMRAMFPGQEVITYAPADNKLDDRSAAIAKETYWAIRQGKRGFNSLNPPDSGIGGWYDLKIQGVYNPLDMDEKECTLDELLDIAAAEPVWMIEMFHGLDGGFGAVSTAVATQHFAKMGKMQDEGKLWVASFPEATKYIRERQNTVITDIATEDSRTVTLTMTNLPEDIFNAPLTVRSEVPADWTYAKVTQGGSVQAPELVMENGRYYIYYDAYPNQGEIKIENVTEKPMITITGLKITSEGALEQNAGAVQAVIFSAQTTPAGNVDDSGIGWYVNGVHQEAFDGKLEFSYAPQDVGTYTVYAMDSKTGIKSLEKVITIKEPGLQFVDDFNGYGTATAVPSDNWYSNATVGLEAVSGDGADKAAVFGLSFNEAKYPALHKTANAKTGTPLVYRGKVKLENDGSNKQKFYMEIRNSKEGNVQANRKTVFQINHETITSASGTEIGKIPMGEWLAFSVCIVPGDEVKGEEPGADTALSKIRISLSSPALTDTQGGNKGQDIFFEEEVSLANIAISEHGTCNMLFNNDFSKANEAAKTYLDDIKIYNPYDLRLTAPKETVDIDTPVTIELSKDIYGLDTSKVTVTKEGGGQVTVQSVAYSPLNPGKIMLSFADGALEKNSVYTVAISGVIDAAGGAASGSITFTTSDKDTPVKTDVSIMDGVICYLQDNTVTLLSDADKAVTAYVAVYETIDGVQRLESVTAYDAACTAGVEKTITFTKPQIPADGQALLLIWEDAAMKPIIKAVVL